VELLYLVLRTLDDLVDIDIRAGGSSREAAEARIAAIERWTRGEPLAAGSRVRELIILDDLAARNRAFPRDAVLDFLEGMRADLVGPNIATDDDAARYCYQVAGTVGRMMASLLGIAHGSEAAADRISCATSTKISPLDGSTSPTNGYALMELILRRPVVRTRSARPIDARS
jgi:15-cis-phytoene synthase